MARVEKTIPERYEMDSQALRRAVGRGRIIDVAGLLDVIEAKIRLPGDRAFFIQIILNPWTHLLAHPRVHLVGVDVARLHREDAPEPINEAEGRYIIDIEPDWVWREDPNLVRFWEECVRHVIQHPELHSRLTFRSLPKVEGAYDLFFPSGAIDLAKKIEKRAEDQGLKLINREESRIIETQRQGAAKVEKIARETRLKEYRLEIEKAEDEDTLGDIRTRVERDTSISEDSPALVERIQDRISEVGPSRIDFDKHAKVIDPNRGFSEKGTRVRRFGKRD